MSAKIIICVTMQSAVAAVFESGKLGPCQEFSLHEDGLQAFGKLLRANPHMPVYLMVDSVEEDYRAEVLPHVTGSARQELVRRKLTQLYRSTPYSAAWIQGREHDKRRDDHYLFVALTNADLVRPWLEALQLFQARIAGVYLLPMVTERLVAMLKLTTPELLVVTKHHGGLRQSFFQDRQLKASRLTLADPKQGDSAASLAANIGKTRLYLNSLRLTAREAKLAVLLLDTDDSMGDLLTHLEADPGFAMCLRLPPHELGAHLGGVFPGSAHALHMTVLGLHPPGNNLAPVSATRSFCVGRQRRTIMQASAAVTAIALIWAGANFYQRHQFSRATHPLEMQAQALQARYVEIAKTFPQAPVSADRLEKAVQLSRHIRRDRRTPETAMSAIGRALEANPAIMLSRLNWKFDACEQDRDKTGSRPAGWCETCLVEGEVRPFHGDYRGAMESVERFVGSMAQDKDVAGVSATRMPLDIHSSTALSGNVLAGGDEPRRAEFRIRVQLKGRT